MNTKLMVPMWLGLMVSVANAQTAPAGKSPASPVGTCPFQNCRQAVPASQAPAAPAAERNNATKESPIANLSADEQRLIELTNVERRNAGLSSLKPNATLMKLARDHSANMARLNMLGHTLDGVSFDQRLTTSGYGSFGGGENCAMGSRTPEDATAMWMQSSGHKANILGSGFQEIGAGMGTSSSGQRYWTLVFAAPSPNRSVRPVAAPAVAPAAQPAPSRIEIAPQPIDTLKPMPAPQPTPSPAPSSKTSSPLLTAAPVAPATQPTALSENRAKPTEILQLEIVNAPAAKQCEGNQCAQGNPATLYVLAYQQHRAGQLNDARKTIRTANELEQLRPIANWGRLMERYQGPSRVWVEDTRRK